MTRGRGQGEYESGRQYSFQHKGGAGGDASTLV
jgi:hypothetical protein